MDWIAASPASVLFITFSVLIMYASLIGCTRLMGLRSFSKVSGFDFAITVAIGSVIAGTILSKSPPVLQGAAAIALLFIAQMVVAIARVHWPFVSDIIDNSPRFIMIRQEILDDQLKAAKMSRSDLWSKLREANVLRLEQVEAVIAESTGDVSVLHHNGDETILSDELIEGVIAGHRYREIIQGTHTNENTGT